jgi:hypothetical protein
MDNLVERSLKAETEGFQNKTAPMIISHYKSHKNDPRIEPGIPRRNTDDLSNYRIIYDCYIKSDISLARELPFSFCKKLETSVLLATIICTSWEPVGILILCIE